MTSPLVAPIAEALAKQERDHFGIVRPVSDWLPEGEVAADAVVAVVAALPADYTAADVLAFLRGEPEAVAPVALDAPAPAWTPCEACQGGGYAVVTAYGADGVPRNNTTTCPRCGGTGTEGEK